MERLLLLNTIEPAEDVVNFITPEPAYKLVSILKQDPMGLSISKFLEGLSRRMAMSLVGCDFNDFLMRWRFLSFREEMVLFTPQSGSTVFF